MADRPARADLGASLLAKLKNKAKADNINYQQVLRLFFQEEFLRRLSKSAYADNFVLKGGLFIYALTNFKGRSTVDIDFMLRRLDNNPAQIDKIIAEIITVPTGLNETIIFEAGKSAPIAVQREYHGISCQITGHIKKVRLPFSVDIGVGDVILPKPKKRIIQPQLEGYEAPCIYTYSLESTIAEKLDAILQRFELTGRMKDFYDIYYLALTFDFEGEKLKTSISETLKNRKTGISPDSFDRIIKLADDNDIQVRWRYF
jgi:predicted nucleotidyltransferase component of viral defense system